VSVIVLFPASRKWSPVGEPGTRKRRLAYYSYNSRDGGYSENTDLLRNRANQHVEGEGAVVLEICQTIFYGPLPIRVLASSYRILS
jgi:hypothetical protein